MNGLSTLLGFIFFAGSALALSAPTSDQLQSCREQTGWTIERCKEELTR
jgi:hypothetical protein